MKILFLTMVIFITGCSSNNKVQTTTDGTVFLERGHKFVGYAREDGDQSWITRPMKDSDTVETYTLSCDHRVITVVERR